MSPRTTLPLLAVFAALVAPAFGADAPPSVPAVAGDARPDVLVYGGTPAGVATALAAGRAGRAVLLVEPYGWVGGLVTNGLSHVDLRTFEAMTGPYLDFARRVEAHYVATYGKDSPQATDCLYGTHAEPKVNRMVFERMLADLPNVTVIVRHGLAGVEMSAGGAAVASATFAGADGKRLRAAAGVYVDATYEGDLMAAAGVPWRAGREGRDEYGESLAPPEPDGQLQGYNFRLMMTNVPANRVAPSAPPGYDRAEFAPVVPLLESGRVKEVFCLKTSGIYKAQKPSQPNGKHDINDVSNGLVRLSLPGRNTGWPDGDVATRKRIFDEHLRHNVGLLYFLQTDPAVPQRFRDDANQWGWCRDEFADNGHVPEQVYVREARRMVGAHVFAERDTDPAPGDARSVLRTDAVATGDYGPNCHGTAHEGPRIGGKHAGEFYKPVAPYQVPYGVIVPKRVGNLLVPVAASASHVGFCALRLEPIWMSLGDAAGHAAHLALADRVEPRAAVAVQRVSVPAVQARVRAGGGATAYVSDVPPASPDFVAVQWWGTAGGLHGLEPAPAKPGQRGEPIVGQYYEAFPGHAARLALPLDGATRVRWLKLAEGMGVSADAVAGAATRGAFVRAAYTAAGRAGQ